MQAAILRGYEILLEESSGTKDSQENAGKISTALRACVEAVKVMENKPGFNAGFGSVLTEMGIVEMDASVSKERQATRLTKLWHFVRSLLPGYGWKRFQIRSSCINW